MGRNIREAKFLSFTDFSCRFKHPCRILYVFRPYWSSRDGFSPFHFFGRINWEASMLFFDSRTSPRICPHLIKDWNTLCATQMLTQLCQHPNLAQTYTALQFGYWSDHDTDFPPLLAGNQMGLRVFPDLASKDYFPMWFCDWCPKRTCYRVEKWVALLCS